MKKHNETYMEVSTMEMKQNFNKYDTMKPIVLLISMHYFFKKESLTSIPMYFFSKAATVFNFAISIPLLLFVVSSLNDMSHKVTMIFQVCVFLNLIEETYSVYSSMTCFLFQHASEIHPYRGTLFIFMLYSFQLYECTTMFLSLLLFYSVDSHLCCFLFFHLQKQCFSEHCCSLSPFPYMQEYFNSIYPRVELFGHRAPACSALEQHQTVLQGSGTNLYYHLQGIRFPLLFFLSETKY